MDVDAEQESSISDIEIVDMHFKQFKDQVEDPRTTNRIPKSLDFLKNNLEKVDRIESLEDLAAFKRKAQQMIEIVEFL